MNVLKRGIIFVTFFGCCFCIALMAASLGTDFWFQANATQKDVSKNYTEMRTKAKGEIHFGLFKGEKILDWGIGIRQNAFYVNRTTAPHMMHEGLWVATIALVCFAILFSLVASLFALINTATTPIEAITGVPGLYLWNAVAAGFGLASVVCWGLQHSFHLSSNVLDEEASDGWTTEGQQSLGYSFWLVVVAIFIHLANCALIAIGTCERREKVFYEPPDAKTGNIMLY